MSFWKHRIGPMIAVASCVFAGGCASVSSMHPDHDDLIKVVVENAAPHEAQVFEKYFRAYINDVMDGKYIGDPVVSRTARFTMKVVVLDRPQTSSADAVGGSGTAPIPSFNYRIRVDLVRSQDKLLVWSWHPDRVMAFPDYQKSIKWLSKYSAKQLKKQGLLSEKNLN